MCKFWYQLTVRYGQTGRAHVLAHFRPLSLMLETFLLWVLSMGVLGCMVCLFVCEWAGFACNGWEREAVSVPFNLAMRSILIFFSFRLVISLFWNVFLLKTRWNVYIPWVWGCFVPEILSLTTSNYFHVHGLRATVWAFVFGRTNVSLSIRIAWTWGCVWKFMLFLYWKFHRKFICSMFYMVFVSVETVVLFLRVR